jgi:DNA invertase Pin-like site-specific DNA recombinase
MRRAGVYLRISRDTEGEGLGVQRQEADARALADRRGWEVVEVYKDNDISATGKRPGWEKLLRDIEGGYVDALIAYSSSRMYRRPADLERLIKLAEDRDLDIATVASGNIDLTTADGRMLAGLLATIDRGEMERVGERVRRKLDDRSREGKRWGGRRPFGYTKGMKIDQKEARTIRQGKDLVLGGATAHRVAATWNEAGKFTPTGRPWSTSRVREVLSSALIAGKREQRRDGRVVGTYDGAWSAIITEDEHIALRALLEATPTGRPNTRRHLLTGVLRCSECGAMMNGRTDPGGRRSYACNSGQGGCGRCAVSANASEDHVLDALAALDPEMVHKRAMRAPQEVDREVVRRLGEIAARRERLQKVEVDEHVDMSEPLRALDAEERELQASLAEGAPARIVDKDSAERRNRRHHGELTEAEVLQSHEWVRSLVDEVKVRRAKSTREPAAERLTIKWR